MKPPPCRDEPFVCNESEIRTANDSCVAHKHMTGTHAHTAAVQGDEYGDASPQRGPWTKQAYRPPKTSPTDSYSTFSRTGTNSNSATPGDHQEECKPTKKPQAQNDSSSSQEHSNPFDATPHSNQTTFTPIGDPLQVIDADEREFEQQNKNQSDSCGQTTQTTQDDSKSTQHSQLSDLENESIGSYFMKKSPFMGNLSGTGPHPIFDSVDYSFVEQLIAKHKSQTQVNHAPGHGHANKENQSPGKKHKRPKPKHTSSHAAHAKTPEMHTSQHGKLPHHAVNQSHSANKTKYDRTFTNDGNPSSPLGDTQGRSVTPDMLEQDYTGVLFQYTTLIHQKMKDNERALLQKMHQLTSETQFLQKKVEALRLEEENARDSQELRQENTRLRQRIHDICIIRDEMQRKRKRVEAELSKKEKEFMLVREEKEAALRQLEEELEHEQKVAEQWEAELKKVSEELSQLEKEKASLEHADGDTELEERMKQLEDRLVEGLNEDKPLTRMDLYLSDRLTEKEKIFIQSFFTRLQENLQLALTLTGTDQYGRQHDTVALPPWKPDSSSDRCNHCKLKFSWTNRKHHCRICGFLCCAACTRKRFAVNHQSVRVCDRCFILAQVMQDPGMDD